MPQFNIGPYLVGDDAPTLILAEAGINHNGDLSLAKQLIDAAHAAGANLIKFQKRTPEICVPDAEKGKLRETPWGEMSYLDYRYKIEFGQDEYEQIDAYCKQKGILWTASAWDVESVRFLEQFAVPCHKVPSALLTHRPLIQCLSHDYQKPLIVSTGMSTFEQIEDAYQWHLEADKWYKKLGDRLALLHCTSAYPCPTAEQNLAMIPTLQRCYGNHAVIGYSGHELGMQTTLAAVALGAKIIERHLTLDRSMWGTDQAASLEPGAFTRLVRDIRIIEEAMGDGVKRVYDSELSSMKKLRYII